MGLIADAAAALGNAVGAGNLPLAQSIAQQIVANFTGTALNNAVFAATVNTAALPAPCTGAAVGSPACTGLYPSPPPGGGGGGGGGGTSASSLALPLGLGLGLGLPLGLMGIVAGVLLLRRRRKIQVVSPMKAINDAQRPWDPQNPQLLSTNGGRIPTSPGGSAYPPVQGSSPTEWGGAPRPWAFGMPALASETRGVMPAPPSSGQLAVQQAQAQAMASASADYYGQQAGSPRPPWATGSTGMRPSALPPIPDSPTKSRMMMSLPAGGGGGGGPGTPLGGTRGGLSPLGGNAAFSRSLPRDLPLGPYGTPMRLDELSAATPSAIRVASSSPQLQVGASQISNPPTPTKSGADLPSSPSALAGQSPFARAPGGGVGMTSSNPGQDGQPRLAAAYGPLRPGLSITVPESDSSPPRQ